MCFALSILVDGQSLHRASKHWKRAQSSGEIVRNLNNDLSYNHIYCPISHANQTHVRCDITQCDLMYIWLPRLQLGQSLVEWKLDCANVLKPQKESGKIFEIVSPAVVRQPAAPAAPLESNAFLDLIECSRFNYIKLRSRSSGLQGIKKRINFCFIVQKIYLEKPVFRYFKFKIIPVNRNTGFEL